MCPGDVGLFSYINHKAYHDITERNEGLPVRIFFNIDQRISKYPLQYANYRLSSGFSNGTGCDSAPRNSLDNSADSFVSRSAGEEFEYEVSVVLSISNNW